MTWLDVITAAENQSYVLGEHDCLRVACGVVQARTGVDYWPRFKGYRTHRQALVTIARIAPTLREAITTTLNIHAIHACLAQRGDLALFDDGQEHIGVCVGEHVVVLGPEGLLRVKITDSRLSCAWRIVECQQQ